MLHSSLTDWYSLVLLCPNLVYHLLLIMIPSYPDTLGNMTWIRFIQKFFKQEITSNLLNKFICNKQTQSHKNRLKYKFHIMLQFLLKPKRQHTSNLITFWKWNRKFMESKNPTPIIILQSNARINERQTILNSWVVRGSASGTEGRRLESPDWSKMLWVENLAKN